MKQFIFSGHSDDIFMVDGAESDEFYPHNNMVTLKLVNDYDGMFVHGMYDPSKNGCWMVGISQLDEDVPIPMYWKMDWSSEGYTTVLTLTVPDDVQVIEMKDE